MSTVATASNRIPCVQKSNRIIGDSTSTELLIQKIDRVAPFDTSVLITGPSGTGKELVARRLHEHSNRSQRPFVPVDCANLTGELMVSQLFGHERGAFTGANYAALGCFRAADRGTLFLDEIGELPITLQVKLLRALQERVTTPLGAHRPVPADVRLVAATNRELKTEVAHGRFREDLYYRINVVNLRTAALAERPGDIESLAKHFLEQLADEGHPHHWLTPGAVSALERFAWPGNVRQLRNVMEQAVIEAEEEWIAMPLMERLLEKAASVPIHRDQQEEAADTPASDPTTQPAGNSQEDHDWQTDWQTLAEHEKCHLIATLERTYYNRSIAARLLGISRQALLRRMSKHGIEIPELPGKLSSA